MSIWITGILLLWIVASIGGVVGWTVASAMRPHKQDLAVRGCAAPSATGTLIDRQRQLAEWRASTGCASCLNRGYCETESDVFFELAVLGVAMRMHAPHEITQ
jgi:hypothetical protein